ncbi:hypothetical protein ACFLR2_00615 [Chlamydiota bacterium]
MNPFFSWSLKASGPVSTAFRAKGIDDLGHALRWVHSLPYGRNSNRENYMLIFSELRGTCSTKHAALAALALENGFPIKLQMTICKLDTKLDPKVLPLLDRLGVSFFPEAHCYLEYEDQQIDITFPDQAPTLKVETLEVHTIRPEDIGDHKLPIHQEYLKKWLHAKNLDQRFSFEEVWQLREEWIHSLNQPHPL